jgi:AbrB family looped-hinge helix DNA binding protein
MADFSSTRSPEDAIPKKKVCPESRTLSVTSGSPGLFSGASLGFAKPIHSNSPISFSCSKKFSIISVDISSVSAYNKSRAFPTYPTLIKLEVFIMLATAFVDNAKVMSKGQVTIPKDVREVLGVSNGDRVTFIVEGNSVRIVNSAVYAMQMLQNEMNGEAERSGLDSEEDILALVNDIRYEGDSE